MLNYGEKYLQKSKSKSFTVCVCADLVHTIQVDSDKSSKSCLQCTCFFFFLSIYFIPRQ